MNAIPFNLAVQGGPVDTQNLGASCDVPSRVFENLLKQPGVELNDLLPVLARFDGRFSENPEVLRRAAISIQYDGYISKQQREIDKSRRFEQERIPDDFSYHGIPGLKTEASERLSRYRPASIGQAGRLEGVTPGDLAVLSVYVRRHKSVQTA